MKILRLIAFILSASVFTAAAQPGAPSAIPEMDTSFIKLLGGNTTFTGTVEVEDVGPSGAARSTMPLQFAMVDGRMRMEADMGKLKTSQVSPEVQAQMEMMKKGNLDRVVSITRPDKKKVTIIYPGLKAYGSTAISDETVRTLTNRTELTKKELGKETVDGHPCVKSKVTLPGEDGKTQEYTVWAATDLKDFPIKLEVAKTTMVASIDNSGSKPKPDGLVRFNWRNVQFAKPDAKLFEPPGDYKDYGSIEDLMRSVFQKMLGDMPQ